MEFPVNVQDNSNKKVFKYHEGESILLDTPGFQVSHQEGSILEIHADCGDRTFNT